MGLLVCAFPSFLAVAFAKALLREMHLTRPRLHEKASANIYRAWFWLLVALMTIYWDQVALMGWTTCTNGVWAASRYGLCGVSLMWLGLAVGRGIRGFSSLFEPRGTLSCCFRYCRSTGGNGCLQSVARSGQLLRS